MITGDASYIKKMNRSLILREILKEGMISRADVSKATALTRATVSGQVAVLLEEELVVEKEIEYNLVGRKPIMLSINAEAGYAIGVDLEFDRISFAISDLEGKPALSETINLQTRSYPEILSLLIARIKHYQQQFSSSRYGIIGIVIAIHGLVSTDEVIHYIPSVDWHDVPLKNDLEKALGMEVKLENNANLSAFAERVFFHHETDDLLSVTLHSGIGMGMMVNHTFFRGKDGFAGEIGHMIVAPGGLACNCGNQGCWEKYASETSVLQLLRAKKPDSDVSYEQVGRWMEDKDPDVAEIMEQFISYLSIGLNNIINIYNPEVVVLDSELLRIYPDSLHNIEQNLNSRISLYSEIKISTIGKQSCALGACALAIQNFLQVPDLNLPYKG